MSKSTRLEKLLWSIALPGFGQLLNKRYIKGIVLIILEFIISVNTQLNQVIVYSFYGNMEEAIGITNYQWLMFYPCVYMFAMWDAFKDDNLDNIPPYLFLPFVGAAFIGTIGVIYSATFSLFGVRFGPILLPIIGLCLGAGIGALIRNMFIKNQTSFD